METLISDIRYAVRKLMRSPAFTIVAALTLALGIGANSAIFSVVNAVLLRSLPFPNAQQLVRIYTLETGDRTPTSGANYLDWRAQNHVFSDVAAVANERVSLTGVGDPAKLEGAQVTANLFDVLGVQPMLGRNFRPEENDPANSHVVILSHGLWQQRFGANPGIVGNPVMLDGKSYTVVGVMPESFDYPRLREVWTPMEFDKDFRNPANRNALWMAVIARMKPGVTVTQAHAEMKAISRRIEIANPEHATGVSSVVVDMHDSMLGDLRTPLLVLLGAVGFVLLIACANVANLLLARASSRTGELALRSALGAGRPRLIQQLVTESVVLGVMGGALGLILGTWGAHALVALQPPSIPLNDVGVDGTVIGFTAAIAIFTGILFGFIPALQVTRGGLVDRLKEDARGSVSGRTGNRARSFLVILETALAVVLLTGAALLIKSFAKLQDVDPGFNPGGTLSFQLSLPEARYPTDASVADFYARAVEQLRSLPGVRSVGGAVALPMSGRSFDIAFEVRGRPAPPRGQEPDIHVQTVTPDYFRSMQVPVQRGRVFTDQDRSGSQSVVLLNATAVRQFFPHEDPIGKHIAMGWHRGDDNKRVEGDVVGVVGDVKQIGLDKDVQPEIYFPEAQLPLRDFTIVMRTAGDPVALSAAAQRAVHALDANLPVANVRTLQELLSLSVAQPRFFMTLLVCFAAVALLLAGIGIFGVISYSVAQRRREIGIRIALGALPANVLRLVVASSMRLAMTGIVAGVIAAFLLTRVMASLLFHVSTRDPLTLLLVATVLAAVAFISAWLPARAATRADPLAALRAD